MEEAAQAAPVAPETSSPAVSAEPEMPESFNIFSDEPAPPTEEPRQAIEPRAEPEQQRSKAFLEKVRLDRQKRTQEIEFKKREAELSEKSGVLNRFEKTRHLLESNPDEFFRQNGVDPATFYENWSRKKANPDKGATLESQLNMTQMELAKLRAELVQRDKAAEHQQAVQKRNAVMGEFVGKIEHYASSVEKYPLTKESCTAQDVADGMAAYYKQTGQRLTIEEAFEKIESGLRTHEERLYTDPRTINKIRQYNPGISASETVNGPQATLSSAWNQQPTRKNPEDMSYEEIRELYKGKLFT